MTGRTQFQEAMAALRSDVDWLGSMSEEAVRRAVAALLDGERSKAEVVIEGDDEIDTLLVTLEERAYVLMAQQAPVAVDLRFLVSSLRVMADFERAGDRAVSVAKLSLDEWPREPETLELLREMADQAVTLLGAARQAWRERDLTLALQLEARDDALDTRYGSLVDHLRGLHGPDASGLVLHALLAGRHLERIADYAVAVGDRVSYMLTGDPQSLAAEIG